MNGRPPRPPGGPCAPRTAVRPGDVEATVQAGVQADTVGGRAAGPQPP